MTQTETRIFEYGSLGHIIAETNQTGQMLAEYIYLGDQLLAMIKPGETAYYFHNDHLGTPQVLTDATQAVVWKAAYTPFGEAVTSIATVENPFRFPGQYYDAETGLHYNYYRYYNPPIGRYLTPDPIGLRGGINLFVYVNNPINWTDPFGLTWKSNLGFFWDWAAGQGSDTRSYGPTDIETQEMMNSLGADALRNDFYSHGCSNRRAFGYGSGQAAWDTLLNPATRDWSSTAAQVGGFAGASAVNNGDGTVTFTIPNVAGTNSFFYHLFPDRGGTTGPGRNIYQTFQWTEKINADACKCKK